MLVDLERIMDAERADEERKLRAVADVWRPGRRDEYLYSEPTERSVIVAMLMGGEWLAACDAVELGDFADFRYRAIFRVIRNLQEARCDVDACIVADTIENDDRRNETHIADTVHMAFLCELLCTAPRRQSPTSALSQMDRDFLRELADRRRSR